jgi:chromosome segregation ATPase
VSYADYDHRGDYADQRHDHDGDYAEKHHRHYDHESAVRGLRQDLAASEERIRELRDDLRDALERIRALEDRQPDYATDELAPGVAGEDGRKQAYIKRRVIQEALAGSDATREDVARTVAAARQEWQAASDEERATLMRAAEEAVNPWGVRP